MGEVRPEVGARRSPPVGAAVGQPVEIGRDRGLVRASGVLGGVTSVEAAQEPLESGDDRPGAHASGALSVRRDRPADAVWGAPRPPGLARPPAEPPDRPPRRAPPPRAGFASASGFGGPPGSRAPTSSTPSGSGTSAPQRRQIPVSPFRATGPSSASWTAPTGSKFVVKSHFG